MPETEQETEPPLCARCGANREVTEQTADGLVCRWCSWTYNQCATCGQRVRYGTTAGDTGRFYCDDHSDDLYTCDRCDGAFEELWDGDACEECLRCDDCGYVSCECDDDYDEAPNSRHLNGYYYKPEPRFHGEGKTFLGLELEVSTSRRTSGQAVEVAFEALGSLGYLKEDSSVSGFEIVTHPMTHDYAADHFPWHMLRELDELGCGDDNAGIHVHVNRSAFDSGAHIYRWLKLIYRNESAVTAIARRKCNEWAAFRENERRGAKFYAKPELREKAMRDSRRGRRMAPCGCCYEDGPRQEIAGLYPDRYSAVNVQNAATFEVRVFASSLVEREVRAALDLVAASVEYTRDLTVPHILAGGWTWSGFMKWAAERPEYAALVAESQERVHA